MTDTNDISGLEAALAERANKQAEEHLAGGRQARERILAETQERLRIEKEREVLTAKARAERAYQQQVQAAELDLRDELVAQFNARDLQRVQKDWERYAREAAPAKQLKLSPDALDCSGGVLVISADRDIRFDNTFEGRMERME